MEGPAGVYPRLGVRRQAQWDCVWQVVRTRREETNLGLAIAGNSRPAAIKLQAEGESTHGQIVDYGQKQATVFGTKDLKFFPSGDPIMDTYLVIQNPETGVQGTLWLNRGMEKALKPAVLQAGAPDINIGDWISMTLTNVGFENGRQKRDYKAEFYTKAQVEASQAAA